jgi:hypothetical protein
MTSNRTSLSALLRWLLLAPLILCPWARGQYSMNWHTIDGGGGTSTNGQYSMTGTIGQPDAGGTMTGGSYSLTGGFWSLISVVQSDNAPTLYIARAANSVTVYWQDTGTWTLQQNADLTVTSNWSGTDGVITSNGTNYLTIVNPTGRLFFRLKQ